MHVLFPIRRFVLCAIAFTLGKLRVVLKIADQSRASSHFNSQNTHSQFRNSHFTHPHFTLLTQTSSFLVLYGSQALRLSTPAVRSVTLNLASALLALMNTMTYLAARLFHVKRDGVDRMTSYRTEPTEKLLQGKLSATIPT